jgi:hypothetical protein
MEKHLNLTFQNLESFFAYAEKAVANGQEKASEKQKESDFNHFANWPACRAAALQGWPAGLEKVKALSEAFVSKVGSGMLKETFAPSETGLFFDVGLVLAGEPEAWLQVVETDETAKGSQLVTIGLNCTVSAGVSPSIIRQRGAAVLALVQLLEQAGRSVCVKVGISLSDSLERSPAYSLKASLVLKAFGEALDADKLAFWLVCEDAFRRCWFRIMEACPIWKQLRAEAGKGYGKVQGDWLPEGTDIGLKGMTFGDETAWNKAGAEAWIQAQLQAQGVSLSE